MAAFVLMKNVGSKYVLIGRVLGMRQGVRLGETIRNHVLNYVPKSSALRPHRRRVQSNVCMWLRNLIDMRRMSSRHRRRNRLANILHTGMRFGIDNRTKRLVTCARANRIHGLDIE